MILYGIANCDTMKKTRAWLAEKNQPYHFHDYKKAGIDAELVDQLCAELGYDNLINKRGTTWRALADTVKAQFDEQTAKRLMLENPSIIKRPVANIDGQWVLGFDALVVALT